MTAASRRAAGAWLLFVVVCSLIVARTQFVTDLSAFLPRSPSPAQQVLVDQLRDGVVSRLILIGIEGPGASELARASKRLAAGLRGDQRFVSVDNGEETGLEKDRDFLWRNRYLLSAAVSPAHFSPAGLRAALEGSLQLLGSPAGMFLQRMLPSDPTAEMLRLAESLAGQTKPETRDGVWFSRDGSRALLLVQTRAAGYDIDAQEDAIAAIRAAFAKAGESPSAAAGMKLVLTGPGVFSVSTRARIKEDAARFALLATVLVGGLLLAVYRSARVLLLALLPVATGALAGIAAVSLAFGSVHGITLGFGATLIGEGGDYAIYLFTQRAAGAAPHSTLTRIWPTLRLGVLTSICGFGAMLLSGFPGLAQLGLFSIVGLIVALTVTRSVLPAFLPPDFRAHAVASLAPSALALVRRAPALRYPALALVALAVGAAAALSGPSLWSDDLASLSPISEAERNLDGQLRRDIGAPDVRHLVVLAAADQQSALEASERITARLDDAAGRGLLESFESPARYLPSLATQRARQAALPPAETLRRNLQHASSGLPFRTNLFEPFLQDVEKTRRAPLLRREDLDGTRLASKVDALLIERGSGWAVMLPLRGVKDLPALAREIAAVPDAQAIVLDLKTASDALYQAYRREAVRNALVGAAAIVALLLVALRSPRRVLDVTAPLVAAVLVVASILVLTGSALSIFHLVGLLLVVAVGSNYSLFFDREAATTEDRERTIVSLVFANLSTVIGFGLLAFSQVPVLHAIGFTVALGAVLSLVFSAIFIARTEPPREPN